ncbi:MAG TPA: 23S rRNA (uracil(1939)-C(5))-methyltransferase RlmD [Saprospiraceae bacterium]|nr:23S rRNA (uracil(1939)-C(5))-methyltransferase RlmD [Saprospiraceae bacterium]
MQKAFILLHPYSMKNHKAMGRINRTKRIAEHVTITGIADKGKAIGRNTSGEVFFVEGAVPGDIVHVIVLKKKSSYSEGVIEEFLVKSSIRTTAPCSHFGVCGGCKWQHVLYDGQLYHKQILVVDALTRIGGVDPTIIENIIPSQHIFEYRNKMEYSFSNQHWLTAEEISKGEKFERTPAVGLHPPGSFDKVVDIQSCMLQHDMGNQIRNHVRKFALMNQWKFYDSRTHSGLLRNMFFRNNRNNEWMINIVFGKDHSKEEIQALLKNLITTFPVIKSLYYTINTKKNDSIFDLKPVLFAGEPFLTERLGKIMYKIGPKSFFQTNTIQAEKLYDKVAEYAGLTGSEKVYDLYTGIGSIALYLSHQCSKVVGIEEVEEAVEDARENCAWNGIANATFYAGDVKAWLNDEFIARHGKPDVLITDPPRAGMHEEVVKSILHIAPEKLIYISCNPSTQARDIQWLSQQYIPVKICPMDMFPHTHHVESIALLKRKGSVEH